MLFSQRRMLHRAVAEWYEQVHATDLAPYYALLAYHWQKAEVIDYTNSGNVMGDYSRVVAYLSMIVY